MFPTFDVPPQHAETVGARKARRAKEEETARRSSSATSQSSGSTHSAKANSAKSRSGEKTGFGWFGKSSKKGIQEITTLPSIKKPQLIEEVEVEPEIEIEPAPRTAPLPPPPLPPPAQPQQFVQRQPSHRSDHEYRTLHSQQQFPAPPPNRSLPARPPSSALPQPPSPGLSSLPDTLGRKSQYSTFSHTSSNPTINSASTRTTFSNKSVFSNASQYDSSISEENYDAHSQYGSNVQFEPVERGSRTGSRQGDYAAKAAQAPFARALAKMEGAGARIIAARLSEEWEGLEDDESYQEVVFEKRLWALTAYQRLTQNKQLQSPAHELLSGSRPADQRRILHLHGSLADGWILATRYPTSTVYTLSTSPTTPTSTYPAPLNHHSLYLPSLTAPSPFPDNYFDAIVSRSLATTLRNDEWARAFFDCMRVLKPGGQIEVLSVDAHLSCEGPKLRDWVDEMLSNRLEAHGVSRQASDTVLDTMEIVGLENIRRARVALPAHSPKALPAGRPGTSSSAATVPQATQDSTDASRMMSFLGRHFYQDLYGKFLRSEHGEEWFWTRRDVRDECERYKTKMVLTIACAVKPTNGGMGESYLDI
ncbi:hypothetical protein FB567DRAFT_539064 [Paraphoma chrysanthemicola]|uniref:Methyltransferase type 11 domain-containing protein n=1 Tax=Paraphoma chrysanthemicola TaxID=798071 RepID=A0A8K0QUD7_9PLEO|nr:hypothetical protein FB567DRAFT_539064 [Paraphoma chrysanthemicola]